MKNLFSLLVLIVCLAPIAFPLEAAASNAAESIAPAVAETKEPGIDDRINEAMKPVAKKIAAIVFYKLEIGNVAVPLTVTWLVLGAVFFTFFFGFINLRGFTHAISLIKGDYDDPNDPGEVNHFQALATAVSGTVGIGNIGGVAVAIGIGGPGAAFWLFVAGFLGMSSKFVECTLGVKYRNENPDGSVSGGPMYYLTKGFEEKGWGKLGRALGVWYAVGIVVGCMGIGNMFQSNQAFEQMQMITGGQAGFLAGKGLLFGIVMAVIVGMVIIGGIKSIAKVTVKVVPFMAILYILGASLIILMNYKAIPWAFATIFTNAFSPEGFKGGAIGVMIVGFQRAVFSNEAGLGSASIAHSAVQTREPVTEGIVSLLEPFIDTMVICMLTALAIITTMHPDFDPNILTKYAGKGIEMTSYAFERNISWSPYIISIATLLFAFSTMISWSYYGLKGWTYLVGEGKRADLGFKFVFCVFVALGCATKLGPVLDISDALVFIICVPNILGLYVLSPVVKKELVTYFEKIKSGSAVDDC